MTRTFFVGGNWKMNGSSQLVNTLSDHLKKVQQPSKVEIVVAPPAPYLAMVRSAFDKAIGVSAQNCYTEKSGAFTGELSTEMLKDLHIDWVILGHSERRTIFKETDELIGKKVAAAVKAGIKVIACIGELEGEREAGKTNEVCFRQMQAFVDNLSEKDWDSVVVAYEPVWAIGTGKVATPEQAQEVHKDLRNWISSKVSGSVAEKIRIIYGGSVNGSNAAELSRKSDIDGFLVGGASLKEDFVKICTCKL